jgi:hypothetical protein
MKIRILLMTFIFIFSCRDNNVIKTKTKEDLQIKNNNKNMLSNILFSSNDIKKYFREDTITKQLDISTSSFEIGRFKEEDFVVKIKENDFEVNPQIDSSYYTIKTLAFPKVTCEVIIYNTSGENNSKIINVQLNCIDQSKKITDKILLDCRLKFEDEYYREFEILNDGTISIKKFTVSNLIFNEEGDIIGDRDVPDTISETVSYKIDKIKLLKI